MDASDGQLVVVRDRAAARRAAPADRPRAGGARRQADASLRGARRRSTATRSAARVPAGGARRSRGGAAARSTPRPRRSRVDLRELPLVTIDGEDAKDFDDAVYCEPNRDGFRLVVAIADVSHYVRPGHARSTTRRTMRATSVYFPGFVVPMLPETLSNGICSLKPKVDRLCFVCDMQIDRDGEVTQSKFYEAVMHSHARLTYTQVWNAVGEGTGRGRARRWRRSARCCRSVAAPAPAVPGARQGARSSAARSSSSPAKCASCSARRARSCRPACSQRNDAHKLIEECMIAANVEAAKFLLSTQIPAPYRVHDRPPEQKYADLLEFLKEFELRMPPWAQGAAARLHRAAEEDPRAPRRRAARIGAAALQSLAVYSPDNIGHFGLALEAYAHFTSPIRRYPDLLVHRAIKHALARRQAGRLPLLAAARWRALCAAVLRARAPRRRGRARSRRALPRAPGWSSTSAASSTA